MAKQQTRRRETPKTKYRVRNWREYNQGLVRRGSLEVWFSQEAIDGWRAEAEGRRGAPRRYSDVAIECALTLKAIYQLPLRATQGLMTSIVQQLGVDVEVMCYSTLSRRSTTLEVQVPSHRRRSKIHLVVDSTGVKIYGEGEWHVRTHGASHRRQWRKVHVGVDEATMQIKAVVVTTSNVSDTEMLPVLLEQVADPIGKVAGDGGYDYISCHEAINGRRARAVIPPRVNARVWGNGQCDDRDEAVRRIGEVGKKQWKQEVNYHRRSLAETTMWRLKRVFGDRLTARRFDTQAVEVFIRCKALNRMTGLGMPDTVAV